MRTFVCDANILVAAFVPEEDSLLAERFVEQVNNGTIRALAPQHALAEVGHALRRELVRKRIPPGMLTALWRDFRSVPVEYVALDGLADSALDLSIEHMASYYDSLYVALALREGVPFVTLERRATNAFERRVGTVLNLAAIQIL